MYTKSILFISLLSLLVGCGNEKVAKPLEGKNELTTTSISTPLIDDAKENDLSFFTSTQYKTMMYKNVEYDTYPELSTCRAGTIKQIDKDNYLTLINEIRALHNLKPILYNSDEDIKMQESALMMNANNALSHNPNSSWPCYTPNGASGAGSANLAIGYNNIFSTVVDGWLIDNNVDTLGHRRWILYAGLQDSAIGFVYRAGSMKTLNYGDDSYVEYVAYPYKNYPSSLMDEYALWNVSLTGNQCEGECYKDAQIRVFREDRSELEVVEISEDYSAYGTAGSLMFRAKDYQEDEYYDVEITLPHVDNKMIEYRVKIVSGA